MTSFFGASPQQITNGSLHLDKPWIWLVLIAFVIAGLVYLSQRFFGLINSPWTIATRTALLFLVAFLLFRPSVDVTTEQKTEGEVLVLIDNSMSMSINDGGALRSEIVQKVFESDDTLSENRIRLVAVGDKAVEIDSVADLKFDANRSDLTDALHDVVSGKLGTQTSSVVVVSDGGDSSAAQPDLVLRKLKAAGIAVNVVGVGSEKFSNDIEIADLRIPSRVIAGDTVMSEVTIKQRGYDNQTVAVNVERDGVLVTTADVNLESNPETSVTLPLRLGEAGSQSLTFSVDPLESEILKRNNHVTASVLAGDSPLDVMHFEGEPRFEVKFLRRALFDETFIRLRSLVRTAENKYYRVGVVDADELKDGFPKSTEDLFRYDVLVIGSANSELLGEAQQRLVRDFVSKRGGGLLLLGSANSFAEGGFQNTALADVMPVMLNDSGQAFRQLVKVQPNPDDITNLIQLPESRWEQLPELTVVNPLRDAKPGASVVLQGQVSSEEPYIVLATHRYGRGRVAALAVRNTWRWQMHADVGPDDMSHETLMRQIVRWLGREVPDRAEITTARSKVATGEPVTVALRAVNESWSPSQSAEAIESHRLEVTTPSGNILTPDFSGSVVDAELAQAIFDTPEPGRYELRLLDENDAAVAVNQIEAFASGDEYFDAEQNTRLLSAIANTTGGQYLGAQQLGQLPDAINRSQRTELRQQRVALWNTPFMICLLLILAVVDWLVRRRWSFA